MFAVALAVAAIPEALSSIVTIVQAMGTQKMVKENSHRQKAEGSGEPWVCIGDLFG